MLKKSETEYLRNHVSDDLKVVEVFDEIDSTNRYAREVLSQVHRSGLAVADHQSDGRGCRGHSFFSPKGGLYMTLYYPQDAGSQALLTLAAGVATVKGIQQCTGVETSLKWVNDIYLNGKKLGGILCELFRNADGSVLGMAVGIGINLHQQEFPEDIRDKACALNVDVNALDLAAAIANHLNAYVHHPEKDQLIQSYRSYSMILNRRVSFEMDRIIHNGIASGIDDEGRLEVTEDNGKVSILDSGEVSLAGWK